MRNSIKNGFEPLFSKIKYQNNNQKKTKKKPKPVTKTENKKPFSIKNCGLKTKKTLRNGMKNGSKPLLSRIKKNIKTQNRNQKKNTVIVVRY